MASTEQRLTQLEKRQKDQELRIRALEAQAHTHVEPDPAPDPDPIPQPLPGPFPPDTTLRYIPHARPLLPARGVWQAIPELGTRYMRIGDLGQRHAYSKIPAWNCDGSLLLFDYGDVLLDGRTFAPIRSFSPGGNANWSPTDASLLYSTQDDGTTLNVTRVTRTSSSGLPPAHDFGFRVSLGKGEGAISDNGIVALIKLGTGTMLTYDIAAGRIVGTINGPVEPDNCTMSRDGRFLIADYGSAADGTGPGKGAWSWNVDGSGGHQILTVSRHADSQVDSHGRQVWVTLSPSIGTVDLETGVYAKANLPDNAYSQGHVSGRGPKGMALFTDYVGTGSKPGVDQVAVWLVGTTTWRVYGFANVSSPAYDSQPQGVLSPDGKYALYATTGPYGMVACAQ